MKRLLTILVLALTAVIGHSQETDAQTRGNFDAAMSNMVLRTNTRDQVKIVMDNTHQKRVAQRKQAIVNRQQQIMRERIKQLQKRQLRRLRAIQRRKIKQRAIRIRRQMQGV